MLSGDAERFAQAQPVGFGELNLVVVEVGLVDDESDLFLTLAQHRGDLLVERREARESVDHEEDERSRRDGEIHLEFRGDGQRCRGVDAFVADASRVEQRVIAITNFGRDDIARHSRLVVNDGNASFGEPVKEAALADIGSADDGDSA